ncbi:four helix bundle protein [Ulvibacter sp. MAR_2010_11]|uniref:four helix bundle protein n=1 Tax=Ulvibacter sp. MAR_2010_11 TaxID=1250229 RepID=UPI000CA654EC|nr:four helix bundle protein [Ulvibacter sp. MAR_2010_11]PKA82753.1 four helix bundle protein [Ulvibacter sp. MAR_2010_11]
MGSISSYKELIVWQKSISLVKLIYECTASFPQDEKFGLISQMNRAAVSIPSNIAEGWGRNTAKNYIQFLRTARGSLFELETQLLIAVELKYITDCMEIEKLIVEISKMLNSLIKKLEMK